MFFYLSGYKKCKINFGLAFFLLVVNIVNFRLKIPLGMKSIVATDFNPLNEKQFHSRAP